jgi:maltose-binding protein MalE
MNSKLLIAIGIISALGISSFIIYKQMEISNRQKDIETNIVKQKDLQDSITRSMNEYATRKDIEKFIKDNGVNLQVIQDDLDKLRAEVIAVNDFDVNSGGTKKVMFHLIQMVKPIQIQKFQQ